MRLRFSTVLILFTAVAPITVRSQVSSEQIGAVFASLKSDKTPGAAVIVVSKEKAVFRRGYGVTDLRTKDPIDPSTNFRLASVSKQFTAMCIMLLVHDGKVIESHMARERVSMDELHRALREHGINSCDQVALAVLEVDGSISCLKYDEIKPDANTHLVRRRFIQKKQ